MLIFIDGFVIKPNESDPGGRGLYVAMPASGSSWTTAIYFNNGHINSSSTADNKCAEIDGTSVGMTNVYCDIPADSKGIKFAKTGTDSNRITPYIDCENLVLDGSSGIAVVETSDATLRAWCVWLRGTASVDGKMKPPSGSQISPMAGPVLIPYQSQANYLQVLGELALGYQDSSYTGYDNRQRIYTDGTHLFLENTLVHALRRDLRRLAHLEQVSFLTLRGVPGTLVQQGPLPLALQQFRKKKPFHKSRCKS